MTPAELAVALAAPTSPLVGRALALLTPTAAQCLANEASGAALAGWQTIVADRVQAFAAEQPEGREAVVAAYFTPTELNAHHGLTWYPFIAALTSSEEIPDLRATHTTVCDVPADDGEEAEAAVEQFGDRALAEALSWLAILDPPGQDDILRVHLPTRRVTRLSL
ncbi:hypothetical protein GCM10010245_82380 [Streptomyces spectabilis]|uniref:Uncharacterized protein n=1 Tax=Streptomyces spectabilis TaxID=68270 RepID=A0A7W8B2S4_STRST|nr:hypothetical protein [Streptomyces spectabilis]MBB5109309.1 hypothetical protein [Streptomyces spectabilis]GGV52358.1 hypothetical protein GCM10010245_82380 [Streptomyces spectabilis]